MLEEFLETLKSQNDIFSTFYEKENNLRVFILREDFENTKQTITDLDNLQSTIAFLENKRNVIYGNLKKQYNVEESGTFELLYAKLENTPIKKEIKIEYDNLRLNLFSIQRLNSSIAEFIETKIVLVNSLLSEIYPEKKNTNYAKNGRYGQNSKESSAIINYNF